MVGGVLVERTVKEVLPALVSNRDKMGESSHESILKLAAKHSKIFTINMWKRFLYRVS